MHWWLPNDEGYPTIVRSIRKFVEERTSPAKDLPSEDLRDMKAIFASLNLDDGKSSLPPTLEKRKRLADGQGWAAPNISSEHMQHMGGMDLGEGDAYELGYEEGQGFWGEGQGRVAYGIPKPRDFS
jgi:hypothetical protein